MTARWSSARRPHQGRLALPTPPRTGIVDFDVHGILGVRVRDARPGDLAAVSRELGSAGTAGTRAPDIVVCFVDELSDVGIEYLEDGTPYRDGGVLEMDSDEKLIAHVRLGEPLGGAIIVCKRGLGRVPFLSEAIDLAALSHDWIPLHASGWVARGMGVLAAGRGGSGRTGALLAACQHGATPIAAEHVLVAQDGRSMVGLDRAMTLPEWQVAQVELLSNAFPDVLILLETHDRAEIAAVRLDPDTARERLSMCLQAELMPALQGHLALRATFAGTDRGGLERVPKLATRLLGEATRGKPCYLVRHPEECALEELHSAIEHLLPAASASERDARGWGNPHGKSGSLAGEPVQ